MSINYTTLFTRLGSIIKQTNVLITLQGTTLMGSGNGADAILSQYEARRDLVTGLQEAFTGWASAAAGWVSSLKGYSDRTLADLQGALNARSTSAATIVPLLAAQMAADAQSVKPNTITAPSVAAVSGNTGNGVLLASKVSVAGIDDQTIISETLKAVCTSDSSRGSAAGGEQFSVTGLPTAPAGSYLPQGNGAGPTIAVANNGGSNRLTNGDFETWSGATPGTWNIVAGSALITQETVNVHQGAGALNIAGDGSTPTVTLNQVMSSLTPSARYAAGAWLRIAGTFTTGSTLSIAIKGTGYTTVNLYSGDPHGLTTTYALESAFFSTPELIPADFRLEISWTSANSAGAAAVVLVDDVAVAPAVNFGGVYYALFRGSIDFLAGDAFTITTASDYGGVIQSFFARFYDVALPSSGSPTIADSLAT